MVITYLDQTRDAKSTEELTQSLHPLVRKWFFSQFLDFTPAQKLAVYPIHCRENVLVSAPTGSSKTLTAFLAVLNQLVDDATLGRLTDKTQCLYISPLKALNYDIEYNLLRPLREIEAIYGKALGIRVGVRTSDTTQAQRAKMKKVPPHILITTPESLGLQLAQSESFSNLSHLQWVIIDEIHALCNKRGVLLSLHLELLSQITPFTRIGLSATAEPLLEIASFLVGKHTVLTSDTQSSPSQISRKRLVSKQDSHGLKGVSDLHSVNLPCDKTKNCFIAKVSFDKQLDLRVEALDFLLPDYENYTRSYYNRLHELIQSHKSTLIFTNTRSGTEKVVHELKARFEHSYYEINEEPPFERSSLIGAHHSSLSKEVRFHIEQKLREGKLKCVVCSTSLELGIDIGFIDQVILLHSPKSVSRLLQRVGRSGHKYGGIPKGILFSHSYEELLENTVIVQHAKKQRIDAIHIPKNCLDILSQFIIGSCLVLPLTERELYYLISASYCFDISFFDFMRCVHYVRDESYDNFMIFPKLEADELHPHMLVTKKGAKLLYLQNIGSIVGSGSISVKIGDSIIGSVDEAFVEMLKPGDVFVLGGETYVFKYARGMTVQVSAASGRSPTVPRWSSQALGLSLNDAQGVLKLTEDVQKNLQGISEPLNLAHVLAFFESAEFSFLNRRAIYLLSEYFFLQFTYARLPHLGEFVVEQFSEGDVKFTIVHSSLGRYANEGLALLLHYAARRRAHVQTTYAVTDFGFYLQGKKFVDVSQILKYLREDGDFFDIVYSALEGGMHVRQRFRSCATRALLLLDKYKGETKSVAKQQVKSQMLWSSLITQGYKSRQLNDNFDTTDSLSYRSYHPIVKETYQEVIRDLSLTYVENLLTYPVSVIEKQFPSPFAFGIILCAYMDVLRASDRYMYIQNLRAMVVAKLLASRKICGTDVSHFSQVFNTPLQSVSFSEFVSRSSEKEDSQNVLVDDVYTREFEPILSKNSPKQLELDLSRVLKKIDLDPAIAFELRRLVIDAELENYSPQFKAWLAALLSGTIPKVWSDLLIVHLKDMQLKLR
jgi:ATP-dependent helicase Lhr and Lhr-like helicase